ncbi:MAG: EF-hand domain-containing protein [Pseudoalteromonas sp.]|uniref:EF-hand domain-containing protein n=1 Tax=unclassified Pseudoalteromonas TaxID=194690 RepID=UPI003F98E7BB
MIIKKPFFAALATLCLISISNQANAADILSKFKQLDRNSDGLLSRSETANDPALWSRFQSYDSDKDSKLSLSEFTLYASK